jgi:hypothetical protein
VWNFNPYAIGLLCTGVLSLLLTVQLFLRWRNRECLLLGFAMLSIAEWCIFVGFESAVQIEEIKILFAKISYFGVVNCLPFVLLFVLYYFETKIRLTPRQMILLWIIPVFVMVLIVTNDHHNLIWVGYITPPDAVYQTLVYLRGPLYWLEVSYNYVILIFMTVLLWIKFRRARFSIYRNQALIIFLATLPPTFCNLLYMLRIPAIRYLDLTPFGFFFTGVLLFLGLNKYKLLEIAPIARDILFDSLPDGILIINNAKKLVDINKSDRKFMRFPYQN